MKGIAQNQPKTGKNNQRRNISLIFKEDVKRKDSRNKRIDDLSPIINDVV